VKSKRIGGATFQVPTEVRPERKISISMKNLHAVHLLLAFEGGTLLVVGIQYLARKLLSH